MKSAIVIKNLVKSYGSFTLGPINLEIPSGCIIGLIGENGAGKTTLIKALLSIVKCDVGSISVFGMDVKKDDMTIKKDIGVVLDNSFFPELLSPNDIDSVMKSTYKSWDSELYYGYLEKFGLKPNKMIKTFSKGMRKKLEIATSLSHHPKLLILDEPTVGLDPVVRSEILDIFMDFIKDEEHTILFSTHITSDLEHIADKILFLNEGQIILDKTRDEILDEYGVLKCSIEEFKEVDKKDIISYKKNRYDYEILVENKAKMARKYKKFIIDKITLEELMVLMIKGVKK